MFRIVFFSFCLLALVSTARAQNDILRKAQGRFSGLGGSGGGGGDSIQHRTGLEDSITIYFRFIDTSRLRGFDSALYDFTKKFPTPWHNVHLGNFGNASRSLLFTPLMQPGWDHGFHAYDVYNFTVPETHFYNSTRPYSELNYLLGSKSEQLIRFLFTQNIKPNWNMSIEYRLINSPGIFQSQNTNHNNYRITSWYQSKNKRYSNFFILVGNKLQSGENGGITSAGYLDSANSIYTERSNIPTNLGSASREGGGIINPFNTDIPTGTYFTNATYMMRQQYDLGQKDSLVQDTVVIPLFYPRLRLEHTISLSTFHYRFKDFLADSTYYDSLYAINLRGPSTVSRDTFYLRDYWTSLTNDFSIYQFPDAKNAQQFIKVGASWQMLKGNFDIGEVSKNYYNFFLHGEYRNKTRNQKWDVEANGNFYVNGLNAGDYNAHISLKRLISKQLGYLQLGFQNVNRTPSFVFDPQSSFYLDPNAQSLKKENITNLFASYDQPKLNLKLTGNYYLVTNFAYYPDYYHVAQASTLFNVLHISAQKIFRLGRRGWNWKTWIELQQRIGDGPVNLPLISTRNQIGYDGKLGFKNLLISFGLEGRYFTEYKAPLYSPLIGQFVYQDSANVRLERPDISAYMHFRIKSFSAYVRAENLNSLDPVEGGFLKNNIPTLIYPYPGLQIRVGIFWSFVN